MRLCIASSLCAVLLSVSAIASPIDVTSYEVTVPNSDIIGQDEVVVTHNDFVAAEPYVVDLTVATHVPIETDAELAQYTLDNSANAAVMQNGNFERMYS